MSSRRRQARHLLKWERYQNKIEHRVAGIWCDGCEKEHPYVVINPGFYRRVSV